MERKINGLKIFKIEDKMNWFILLIQKIFGIKPKARNKKEEKSPSPEKLGTAPKAELPRKEDQKKTRPEISITYSERPGPKSTNFQDKNANVGKEQHAEHDMPKSLRISGQSIYETITGGIQPNLLNNERRVNYEPTNIFHQTNPVTFPIVLMPEKNTVVKPPVNGKNGNRGITEESFCRDFLMKAFRNEIYDNLTLVVGSTPYEPDLAFIDLKSGINVNIDIEIDEPYDGFERKPTHYKTAKGTVDDERNKGFTDRGWIVVRFAEEQIVHFPNECMKFIALILKYVHPNYQGNIKIAYPNLKQVRIWSEDEARQMAKTNQREKYLGITQFYASNSTRQYKIEDSPYGKRIESSISAANERQKAKINSTQASSTVFVSSNMPEQPKPRPFYHQTEPDKKPVAQTTKAPELTKKNPDEEPRVSTKANTPSQPSPKPYASR